MSATKISKKDALLLTAAGLGMAMSVPAKEGQKMVQATLQSYVLTQRTEWVFYGIQCYIEEALEDLACGRIEGYVGSLEDAQEKCLEELKKMA